MMLSRKLPAKNKTVPRWVPRFVKLFLVAVACILYINLGRDTLFDWDEGIYATLGANAVSSSNVFVPTWNGSTWFEKPPGVAWLSAVGQTIGGHTELGARLLQPAVAVAVLYVIYLLGTALYTWPVGVAAMGILTTFDLFLGRTRAVNADMPLLLGIALTAYLLAKNKKPMYVALAVALSIWFKGVAGLLSILLVAPLFVTKSKKYLFLFSLNFLLFTLPWHLYAYFTYGETFLTPYLREQVLARIGTPIEFHTESRWFYFDYVYHNLGLGVLLVAVVGIFFALRSLYRTGKWGKILPVWWALLPFAIFTVAKTRLFWYILPAYPAIAILIGLALYRVSRNVTAKKICIMVAILICLQGLRSAWISVEPGKKVVTVPDRIRIVSRLSVVPAAELAVLVPPTERIAEAILPATQRISSSFRYGGMPSVVYYYRGHVNFFYNVDDFNAYWVSSPDPVAMVFRADLPLVTSGYRIVEEQGEYVGIKKGVYAER